MSFKKEHTLWVEKYRPDTLENYVGNEDVKSIIDSYLAQNDINHFLFYGPAGTGKTTLAKIIVNNLDCDHIYINASDERGVDTIRDKVQGFASAASFRPLKVVILDEADFLTINAQASLRNIIETFSRSTRFILTCNYVERIILPLQSRCKVLKLVPPSKTDVAKHVANILTQENVTFELSDLKTTVNRFYPDLRNILNTCQIFSKKGTLVLNEEVLTSNVYQIKVIEELSKPTNKSFNNIRQIIADSGVNDYDEMYRFLYDEASKYAPGNEGQVSIILSEMQYQSNFRIDKEINLMSTISQILKTIK
jgi:replication factor C small subunit